LWKREGENGAGGTDVAVAAEFTLVGECAGQEGEEEGELHGVVLL